MFGGKTKAPSLRAGLKVSSKTVICEDILEKLEFLENIPFCKTQQSRKIEIDCVTTDNWKKNSIFICLSYWSGLLLPHNLDVLHIEKNVCDNLIDILLGVAQKSNENLKEIF